MNSVCSGIGIFAACNNYQKIWFAEWNLFLHFIVFAYQFDNFFQVSSSFVNFFAS